MDAFKEHFRKIALAVLVLFASWHYWSTRAVHHPSGVLVPEEPIQGETKDGVFTFKEHVIRPLATFDIRARVLSTERYYLDRASKLSPVDFALGWGPMSDTALLDKLDISQAHRWWLWSYDRGVNGQEVSLHGSNMHMIPSSSSVESTLLHVRVGQVVHVVGKLVAAQGDDGFQWQSSLVRTDTGDHACEIVFVDAIEVTDR